METEERYLAARDALAANLRLQDRLREALAAVEAGITANADSQAKVQVASMRVNRTGWFSGLRAIDFPTVGKVGPRAVGPSRFWLAAGSVPEPNADTRGLLEAYRYLPHAFAVRRWTPDEEDALRTAVLRHLQETRHEEFMRDAIERGLPGLDAAGLEARMQEIGALTIDGPGAEEDVLAFDLRRWDLIAMQLPGGQGAAECRSHWANRLRPSLAARLDAVWTPEEDAALRRAAEACHNADWPRIAGELGGARSAAACLRRSRQIEHPAAAGRWTPEEQAALRASVARHAGKGSFWKAVAADLPGRTPAQTMHYWRNHMDATVRKGKWAAEEDAQLSAAVGLFGRKWARVAEAVPTRNQVQCRERWVNILDPGLKKGQAWTAREEAALLEGLRECRNADGSIRWADIARRLPGRTDDACSNRAISLRGFAEKAVTGAEGEGGASGKGTARGRGGSAGGRARKRKQAEPSGGGPPEPRAAREPQEAAPAPAAADRPRRQRRARQPAAAAAASPSPPPRPQPERRRVDPGGAAVMASAAAALEPAGKPAAEAADESAPPRWGGGGQRTAHARRRKADCPEAAVPATG